GLYGDTLCRDFGPLQLKTVRQQMIDAGLARGVINQRIWRIKKAFQWGAENDVVPIMVGEHGKSNYHAVLAVRNLPPGRSKARERPRVRRVDMKTEEATLPHLTRHVSAMIQVQLLTGARPGEVCIMRGCDLNRTGPVWLYCVLPAGVQKLIRPVPGWALGEWAFKAVFGGLVSGSRGLAGARGCRRRAAGWGAGCRAAAAWK